MKRAEVGWAGRYEALTGLAQQAKESRFYNKGDRASLKVLSKEVVQSILFYSNLLTAER